MPRNSESTPKRRYPETAREIEEAIDSLSEDERRKWIAVEFARTFEWLTRLTESQLSEVLRHRAEANNLVTFESGIDPWQACVDWHFRWKKTHRKKDADRIARVHELHHKKLPNGKQLTNGQIAKQLGLNVRQVRRDLKATPVHECVDPVQTCSSPGQ